MTDRIKIGLVINPIAGMGGKVGLKGTDGEMALEKAISLGAIPEANDKVKKCLEYVAKANLNIEICTYPESLGEFAAKSVGLKTTVLEKGYVLRKSDIDTKHAVVKILSHGIDLLVFAGGDGTARDVLNSVRESDLCFGIPTGVKMHSAVFGNSARHCAELIEQFVRGKVKEKKMAEVMDLDEKAYVTGIINTNLYGFMNIPYEKKLIQGLKARSTGNEKYNQESIAHEVIDCMKADVNYLIGPGTTTKTILDKMNIESTLIGVDLIRNNQVIGRDLNERQILELTKGTTTKLIVTPIGGQGYLLGRGNQQLSHEVLKQIGKENIIVVATKEKIEAFWNDSIKIDLNDEEMNEKLKGFYKVVTGYREFQMLKVESS